MKDRDFTVRKNILDLEHSENLSKGITELGIGIGGFITIILSITNRDLFVAVVVALFFALIFLSDGLMKLASCKRIKEEINGLLREYQTPLTNLTIGKDTNNSS